MYPEIGSYWIPPSQPFLECDIDLVREALTILHPADKNSVASPELLQIVNVLNNYLKECNNTFLASERIRLFLLLSLWASVIISFITLAILPISAASIVLICVISLILLSVNIFTLFNQTSAYQQDIDWKQLKKCCSDYTKKLYSENPGSSHKPGKALAQTSSPTSASYLFPIRKTSSHDALNDQLNDHSDSENPTETSRLLP